MVCAHRLHNYGADVRVFITKPDTDFAPAPGHQLDILRRMHVPVILADISVPPALYAGPTLQLTVGPVFATSDIVRIR